MDAQPKRAKSQSTLFPTFLIELDETAKRMKQNGMTVHPVCVQWKTELPFQVTVPEDAKVYVTVLSNKVHEEEFQVDSKASKTALFSNIPANILVGPLKNHAASVKWSELLTSVRHSKFARKSPVLFALALQTSVSDSWVAKTECFVLTANIRDRSHNSGNLVKWVRENNEKLKHLGVLDKHNVIRERNTIQIQEIVNVGPNLHEFEEQQEHVDVDDACGGGEGSDDGLMDRSGLSSSLELFSLNDSGFFFELYPVMSVSVNVIQRASFLESWHVAPIRNEIIEVVPHQDVALRISCNCEVVVQVTIEHGSDSVKLSSVEVRGTCEMFVLPLPIFDKTGTYKLILQEQELLGWQTKVQALHVHILSSEEK